jgi:hypothetical protein
MLGTPTASRLPSKMSIWRQCAIMFQDPALLQANYLFYVTEQILRAIHFLGILYAQEAGQLVTWFSVDVVDTR